MLSDSDKKAALGVLLLIYAHNDGSFNIEISLDIHLLFKYISIE